MDLATLITEVYGLTNRPDRVAETKSAVKAATLKMHQMDYWDRDLFETGIQFPASGFYQNFDYVNALPRWRAAKYFRPCDSISYVPYGKFDIITPDQIFDSYNRERVNVAYLSGTNFNIKSALPFKYMLVGCYLNPDITDSGYSSWIADQHPYAIIYEAARILFKNVGLDAEEVAFRNLVAEQALVLQTSNIQSVGY